MTPKQVRLVKESYRLVLPISEQAATLFYSRLFQVDPAVGSLFAKADMKAQGEKLMAAIGMVVKALHRPESILPQIKALGRRHVVYGVKEEQYETVGAALLWTLEAALGDALTPAHRDAWAAAYQFLSKTMIDAARAIPLGKAA